MMHLIPNYHFGPISSYVPAHMMGNLPVHASQQLPQGIINPNVPPDRLQIIQMCAQCQKEIVLSNMQFEPIQCGYACGHWYHRSCTGLTFEAYQLLRNEPHAEWICKNCENNGNRIWYIKPKGKFNYFSIT